LANEECYKILSEKLSIYVKAEIESLKGKIGKVKVEQAHIGALRSGATIIKVARLCKETLESRASLTMNSLQDLPFDYETDLAENLKRIVRSHFPADLGVLAESLREIVRIAGGKQMLDRTLKEVMEKKKIKSKKLRIKSIFF